MMRRLVAPPPPPPPVAEIRRPPSREVDPWERDIPKPTFEDFFRPALYGGGVLVLLVALWMIQTGFQRAARVLDPGVFRPTSAPETAEIPEGLPAR